MGTRKSCFWLQRSCWILQRHTSEYPTSPQHPAASCFVGFFLTKLSSGEGPGVKSGTPPVSVPEAWSESVALLMVIFWALRRLPLTGPHIYFRFLTKKPSVTEAKALFSVSPLEISENRYSTPVVEDTSVAVSNSITIGLSLKHHPTLPRT